MCLTQLDYRKCHFPMHPRHDCLLVGWSVGLSLLTKKGMEATLPNSTAPIGALVHNFLLPVDADTGVCKWGASRIIFKALHKENII